MKGIIGLLLVVPLLATCSALSGCTYAHQPSDFSGTFYDGGGVWGTVTITVTSSTFDADYTGKSPGVDLNPGKITGGIEECYYPDNPTPSHCGWCVVKGKYGDTEQVDDHPMQSGTVKIFLSDSDKDSMVVKTFDNQGIQGGSVTLRRIP